MILRGMSLALLFVAAIINDSYGSYMLIVFLAGMAVLFFIASMYREGKE